MADDEQSFAPTHLKPSSGSGAFEPLLFVGRSATEDSLIGTSVSGYVIKGRLGQGGMGIVYEGEQPTIGKRVAIKVLRAELAQDPEQVQRLVSEARAVNAVGHRGIVDVFGYGELQDGRHCIVMEYLDGEPLADLLIRNRKECRATPVLEVLLILEEILSALSAAHGAGVIHRDLKPTNIFLCKQRDGSRFVKVIDFGIAKLGVIGSTPSTRASMMIGTPSYMAPEQARGGTISSALDLYAVGVIAFEMLTGQLPYEGESVVSILMQHAEAPIPRPSSRLMNIPDAIDDLVVRLLQKSPADRFQSAEEVRLHAVHARKTIAVPTGGRSGLDMLLPRPQSAVETRAFVAPEVSSERTRVTPAVRASTIDAREFEDGLRRGHGKTFAFAALGAVVVAGAVALWLRPEDRPSYVELEVPAEVVGAVIATEPLVPVPVVAAAAAHPAPPPPVVRAAPTKRAPVQRSVLARLRALEQRLRTLGRADSDVDLRRVAKFARALANPALPNRADAEAQAQSAVTDIESKL